MTKEERAPQALLHTEISNLRAGNEQLGAEVAALRTLLAAVRDLADVPMCADPVNDVAWNTYLGLCASRIGSIAAWADPDDRKGSPASAATLHTSAERLRALAAQPLRYTPKAEPAPANPCESEVTRNGGTVKCAVTAPHETHESADGKTRWLDDEPDDDITAGRRELGQ